MPPNPQVKEGVNLMSMPNLIAMVLMVLEFYNNTAFAFSEHMLRWEPPALFWSSPCTCIVCVSSSKYQRSLSVSQ